MRTYAMSGIGLAVALIGAGLSGGLQAAMVNPESHRLAFEQAKADAEVVAEVRAIAVVCTAAEKQGDQVRSVTLQVALQVLATDKGPVQQHAVVVVSHRVTLPTGPGPGMYGYRGASHRFPFTPGSKGRVALRWDQESRAYVAVAGWVPEPNGAEIPVEPGKVITAKDAQ